MGYEYIDISGDAGVRSWGSSLADVFKSMAEGMYSLITDTGSIEEKRVVNVHHNAGSIENLLIGWLNELIFIFETEGFIGKTVRIAHLTDNEIQSELSGEPFDEKKHKSGLLIKAATYHNLKIEESHSGCGAEVIFDI